MSHRQVKIIGFAIPGRLSLLMVMGLLMTVPAPLAAAETKPGATMKRGGFPPPVSRPRWGGGRQHNGNGSDNRVSVPFNSAVFNRGLQHTINANSGGETVSQSHVCKQRKIFCNSSQRIQ